jgi:hypothetical protein
MPGGGVATGRLSGWVGGPASRACRLDGMHAVPPPIHATPRTCRCCTPTAAPSSTREEFGGWQGRSTCRGLRRRRAGGMCAKGTVGGYSRERGRRMKLCVWGVQLGGCGMLPAAKG